MSPSIMQGNTQEAAASAGEHRHETMTPASLLSTPPTSTSLILTAS